MTLNTSKNTAHNPGEIQQRYSAVAQFFHWATAILVLVAFTFGPSGSEERAYLPKHDFDRQLHETLGLCVIVLLVLRLLWRLVDQQPEPQPLARWMHVASKSLQGFLYLLLFAVPVSAIVGAWLGGHPLTLLAGIEIAPWLGKSAALGTQIATVHTWLGDVILWLAGAHAAAGIYHHFYLKDNVLATMLPRWVAWRNGGKT
jgi:cytochrome b561